MNTILTLDSVLRRYRVLPQYRKRPEVVEAVQLKQYSVIYTSRGTEYGNPGDYVVRTPDGELTVMRQDVFERMYEQIDS